MSLAQYDQALERGLQALAIQQEIGDQQGEEATLGNLGTIYAARGEFETALDYHYQSLAIAREIGEVMDEISSLQEIGEIYTKIGNWEQADRYFEQALTVSQAIGDEVGKLGNVLRLRGRTTEVVQCYEEVLSLGESLESIHYQQLALGSLGAFYWERNELRQALVYLKRAIAIGKEDSTPAEQISDLVHLARVHQALRQPEQAAHYLRVALALAESSALAPELLYGVFGSLASLALAAGDFDQAESYYRRELAIEEQRGDAYNVGTSWLNLGLVAWKRDDLKQATIYWRKALELHKAADNRIGIAIAYLNLGNALWREGDVSTGETHLQTALSIAENLPLPDCARNAWESLGQLRWLEGNPTGAYDAYEQAISWAEQSRAAVIGQTHRISFWRHLENLYLKLIQLN